MFCVLWPGNYTRRQGDRITVCYDGNRLQHVFRAPYER